MTGLKTYIRIAKEKMHISMNSAAFLCLFLYNAAIFVGRYIADVSINWKSLLIPVLLLGAFSFTVLLACLCGYLTGISFRDVASERQCHCTFFLTFFIAFGILAAYYYAFFPGTYSPDSNEQLNEAISGVYSDWHPFIHTFLFFTIPMRLFKAEEAIVFLQIIYFTLGFSYLMMTLRKYGCPKWLCASGVLFVILAPVTGNIMMHPWKDCGLAIFSSVATAHYIHIVLTKGAWLNKKWNMLACSVFWVLTVLVRHNAVLFVLPMIVSAVWSGWKNKRKLFSTVVLFLAVLFLIKGPFYHAYSVKKPGGRLSESVGMCMVIMGNVERNCWDSMDKETADFLYRVASKEIWEEKYVLGNFNSVKFDKSTDTNVIDKAGLKNVLDYTLRAFKTSEMYGFQAFFSLTGIIWKLDGDSRWDITAEADTDKTEIAVNAGRQRKMRELVENWKTLIQKSLLNYPFYYIGWLNLALVSISMSAINERGGIKNAFIGMPLLCYNFGTALLLTGFDWRFFYITYPIAMPMIFLVIRAEQGGEQECGK